VRRTALFLAGLVLGSLALVAQRSDAAPSQSVTLRVFRSVLPSGLPQLAFSGAVSSGAAGEDVTVLQQTCGYSFATAVAAAQTREGGVWDAQPASPALIAASATYHARWRDVQSEPVAIRPPMPVFFFPIANDRWRARVTIGSVKQELKGKIVVLQRLRNRRWTDTARKPLVRDVAGGAGFTYAVLFSVPRGWTVRAFVPARTAAPCFTSNATAKLRS
jgi:hypothetical protein